MSNKDYNQDYDHSGWGEGVSADEQDQSESETLNVGLEEDNSETVIVDTENKEIKTISPKKGKGKIVAGVLGALALGGVAYVGADYFLNESAPTRPVNRVVEQAKQQVEKTVDKSSELIKDTKESVSHVSDVFQEKVEELPSLEDMFAEAQSAPQPEIPAIPTAPEASDVFFAEPVVQPVQTIPEPQLAPVAEFPVEIQSVQPTKEVEVAVPPATPAYQVSLSEVESISQQLKAIEKKVIEQEEVNRRINEAFGGVLNKFADYDRGFAIVGKRFENMEGRIAKLEAEIVKTAPTIEKEPSIKPVEVKEKVKSKSDNYIEFVGRGKPTVKANKLAKPTKTVKVEAPKVVAPKVEVKPNSIKVEIKPAVVVKGKIRSILNGIAWVEADNTTQIYKVGDLIQGQKIGKIDVNRGIVDVDDNVLLKIK